jgi:hypothetical protein
MMIVSLLLVACTKEGDTIYQISHASSNPNGTYRDLYLYCAQHTLGSHVGIYNYTNFGNLYTMSPKDFFVKRKQ